jgi:hypothetical protein
MPVKSVKKPNKYAHYVYSIGRNLDILIGLTVSVILTLLHVETLIYKPLTYLINTGFFRAKNSYIQMRILINTVFV